MVAAAVIKKVVTTAASAALKSVIATAAAAAVWAGDLFVYSHSSFVVVLINLNDLHWGKL